MRGDRGVFGAYARSYDLLYRDKDYAGEARFVCDVLHTHAPGASTLLELGSGTGVHAAFLAAEGYEVCGIERSVEMLARSNARRETLPPEQAARLRFVEGDICHARVGTPFDGVISLFHVVSYQTTSAELRAACTTARVHLKPGGVFLFDCWYGPAVLTDRPAVRVKRVEDEATSVTRIAEPAMHPNENLVDVAYHTFVTDRSSGSVEQIRETHRMRYLFLPEIDALFAQTGFVRVGCGEWLTGKAPGFDTWGVYVVGQATG
jgi:SAM-dependent methyltransferase